MEGATSANLMDITEKKRLQNRMAQQKYRKRLKERIQEFEELKKHIGDFPDQAIGAPDSDPSLWSLNCVPISPAQSNQHPGVSPEPDLDILSSTFQKCDYYPFSLSNKPQPRPSPCSCVDHQWPCTCCVSSSRVSGPSALHQTTPDNQFIVSPVGHRSRETSYEERFMHILNSTHQTGYESIENMIVEYYTANFKADSVAHWSQKSSRRYRLRGMLEDIYRKSQAWPEDERMVFYEALVYIAAHVRTAQNQCSH